MAQQLTLDDQSQQLELSLLLEAIYQKYGYDFRDYSQQSLLRRVSRFMLNVRVTQISELIPLILYNQSMFNHLLANLSITVTRFFRNPDFFHTLQQQVFPYLATFPFFKIWHAGCASGEEVYSTAILLHEHDLLKRAQIYATDINSQALTLARAAIFNSESVQHASADYQQAGGQHKFSSYFCNAYDNSLVNEMIRKRITFASHNLATDNAFAEVELVICRNVMIYFNPALKRRVYQLFYDSLQSCGMLCLGDKESFDFTSMPNRFEEFDRQAKIYKKQESRLCSVQ